MSYGPEKKTCVGRARVLQGNAKLIDEPGAYGGEVFVREDSAAVIPKQFGLSKGQMRLILNDVSGTLSGGDSLFDGITDTIGPKSARISLQLRNPGMTIIEIPGLKVDLGRPIVNIRLPIDVSCPIGTK